jgi:lichenan operon transcriptional antiterminator
LRQVTRSLQRRYREILSAILNKDEYITGSELAGLCNISIRTIRQDIKEINILLKKYNVEINSSIKKGYFLSKENKECLKKHNIIRKVLDYEYIIETPNLPMDRQIYILLKLAAKEYIVIEELAGALYVSAATINNDVLYINKCLKKDLKLGISYSLNKGIALKANENEKRNIISWVLSIRTNISTIAKYWNYLFEETDVITKARSIYHIVSVETRKREYYLSGHSAQLLCYEILVAVKRYQLGFYLNATEYINDELMPVMRDMREKVERELDVNLADIEWLNLQRYFKSKQFLGGTNIINIETAEAICAIDEFLRILHDKFKVNLSLNPDHRYRLLLYAAPMIHRLRYRHCIANKISKNLTLRYKTECKMAMLMVQIIKMQLNLTMELNELAYITLHLVSMCGCGSYKLNTVIVCDYDEAVVSFIKYRIKNCFGEKIEICRVYDYQEFMFEHEENLKMVEFIISTSTIADITNLPFVRINPEVEQSDIDMISEYLENHNRKL